MAHAIKRLLLRAPRLAGRDGSPADGQADDERTVDVDAMALEADTSLPAPILRPAAIFRQRLYDPEILPVWARPRPAPTPDPSNSPPLIVEERDVMDSPPADAPKPTKRSRRPKTDGASGASRPRGKRVAKQNRDTGA